MGLLPEREGENLSRPVTCVGESRACGVGEPRPGSALHLPGHPCLALKEADATSAHRPGPRGPAPPAPPAAPSPGSPPARQQRLCSCRRRASGPPGLARDRGPLCAPLPPASGFLPVHRRWQERGERQRPLDGRGSCCGRPSRPAAGDTWWRFPGTPGHGGTAPRPRRRGLPKALPRARPPAPRRPWRPRAPRSWKIRREFQGFSEKGLTDRAPLPGPLSRAPRHARSDLSPSARGAVPPSDPPSGGAPRLAAPR